MHTDSYNTRRNNPTHRSKSESEHIVHFIMRLKERFDIECSVNQYYDLISNIGDAKILYKINSSNGVYEITFNNKTLWVIYGCKSGELPARLKTALIPYKLFPVPDVLSDEYDTESFTLKVKHLALDCVQLSNNINLDDRKTFFTDTKYGNGLKHVILLVKKYLVSQTENDKKLCKTSLLTVYSGIVKYLIRRKSYSKK